MTSGPVVSDTTPLNYLVLIGAVEVLRDLYEAVHIADEVKIELSREKTPPLVREWIANPPSWLIVEARHSMKWESADPVMSALDAGERDSILLAERLGAKLMIIDDWAGRKAAERRGIVCTGTLGLLAEAASRNLVNLEDVFFKLKGTSFRYSAAVMERLLKEQGDT